MVTKETGKLNGGIEFVKVITMAAFTVFMIQVSTLYRKQANAMHIYIYIYNLLYKYRLLHENCELLNQYSHIEQVQLTDRQKIYILQKVESSHMFLII